MKLFSSRKEAVILKEDTDARDRLRALEGALPTADPATRETMEREQTALRAGLSLGDAVLAELRGSRMPLYVLRGLCLRQGDHSGRIDFLVVTANRTYLLECENLYGSGEETGAQSPGERHLELVRQVLRANRNDFMARAMLDRYFNEDFLSVTVTGPGSGSAPFGVRGEVVPVDRLLEYIRSNSGDRASSGGSENEAARLADFFLSKHTPISDDYHENHRDTLSSPVRGSSVSGDAAPDYPVNEVPVLEAPTIGEPDYTLPHWEVSDSPPSSSEAPVFILEEAEPLREKFRRRKKETVPKSKPTPKVKPVPEIKPKPSPAVNPRSTGKSAPELRLQDAQDSIRKPDAGASFEPATKSTPKPAPKPVSKPTVMPAPELDRKPVPAPVSNPTRVSATEGSPKAIRRSAWKFAPRYVPEPVPLSPSRTSPEPVQAGNPSHMQNIVINAGPDKTNNKAAEKAGDNTPGKIPDNTQHSAPVKAPDKVRSAAPEIAQAAPRSGTQRGGPRHARTESGPICPRCGSRMRMQPKSGPFGALWVCSRYPDCRGIRKI